MATVRYDFPKTIKGDTFNGTLFTVTVNDLALDLTNAIVKMDLRLTPTGTIAKSFTSVGDADITISATPTDGKFTINRQIIDIDAGTYAYDIEIELADGTIKTYISGNWTIIQDVTHVG